MNEEDQAAPPPISPQFDPPTYAPQKDFFHWMRVLFASNPFYPASAALLLFGCYRVSADAAFFKTEWAQLLFNFGSLQLYELLLVVTAIFLARRTIWYDSTLLAALENLLVFVPFILVSQAALMDEKSVRLICGAGSLLALCRFGSMKRFFPELNLPARALGIGSLLLALNVALPLVYRAFGETKHNNLETDAAYIMNEYTWLLILPAVVALANLVPRAGATGSLTPQRRWIPFGAFSLWIISTAVHVYSLGYVYDFTLRPDLIAPALWVLTWTAWRLCGDGVHPWTRSLKDALVVLPVLIPLLAASARGAKTFLALSALNICLYAVACFRTGDNRLVRHLVFVSALMFLGGLPESWMQAIASGLNRGTCVAAGAIAYLVAWTLVSRSPKLALLASFAIGWAIMLLFDGHDGVIHWATQIGAAFLLLHSLRWHDEEHQGASALRVIAGLVWVIQSFGWIFGDHGRFWMPMIPGAVVLGIYAAVQLVSGHWRQWIIPINGGLVMFSGISAGTADLVRTVPGSVLAMIGSLGLFACGTAAALIRHSRARKAPATIPISTKTDSHE